MNGLRWTIASLVFTIGIFLQAVPVVAGQSFINIPSIAGEDEVPGYPGAMAVSKLTIMPSTLTVERESDAASINIQFAALSGTPLGTINAMIYNTAPIGAPDATLGFFNTLISSYSVLSPTTEEVAFYSDNPLELYLQVPGIPGVSSTPGYSDIMQIQSFSLITSEFTIVKAQDSASGDLFLASAQGNVFPFARLLLYDSSPVQGVPDGLVEFGSLLVSSFQTIEIDGRFFDQVSFSLVPVPEPTTSIFVLIVMAATLFSARPTHSMRR